MAKKCILYDKDCSDCKECYMCDLDSSKKCNNCGACLEDCTEFRSVNIKDFIETQDDREKFKKK